MLEYCGEVYSDTKKLSIGFIILNILDVITTYIGLSLGCVEANPIMRKIIHDVPLVIALKTIVPCIIAIRLCTVCNKTNKYRYKRRALMALRISNIIYIAVVISNTISAILMKYSIIV